MVKHAELLKRLSTHFVVPFLNGGKMELSSAVGTDGRDALRYGMTVDPHIIEACEAQVSQAALLCETTPAPFDDDTGTLLYAVHEWFACAHPAAAEHSGGSIHPIDALRRKGNFRARPVDYVRAATQAVQKLPRTLDGERLLTRHLIVWRAFQTVRHDVNVKWWTGSARFFGADAPKRLTALPDWRRVKVEKQRNTLWSLAMRATDEELRVALISLMVAMLDVSPLSRLYLLGDPAQKALGFSLQLPYRLQHKPISPLDAMANRSVARGVVDHLLSTGIHVALPTVALSVLSAIREQTSPRIVKRAIEFCAHTAIVMCMIEAENPQAQESAPLRALLDADQKDINDALRAYWAVTAAACALDERVFQLPLLSDLHPKARAIFVRMKDRLKHQRITAVSEPLTRELARRMPKRELDKPARDFDDATE